MKCSWNVTLIGLMVTWTATPCNAVEVTSPDGNLVVTFEIKDFGEVRGCPCYRVEYKGRPVIAESRLGLDLDGITLSEGLMLVEHDGQPARLHVEAGVWRTGRDPRLLQSGSSSS